MVLAGACAVTLGAELAGQRQNTVFRADTRLVEINALVLDKDGHPLAGLSSADFTVLEDGKQQAIELFNVEGSLTPAQTPTMAASAALPVGRTASGEYSNRAATRASGVTAIVLDRLNTSFEDQKLARDQIIEFLKTVGGEDRIALYVLQSGSLQILHEFSRDNGSLIAALNRYQAKTSRSRQVADASSVAPPASGSPAEDADFERWLADESRQVAAYYLRDRVRATAAAFETAANHLAGVRGRKNLVWVSSSFPIVIDEPHGAQTITSALADAIKAINHANIAVYAVDARQLKPPALATLQPTQQATPGRPSTRTFRRARSRAISGMSTLCSRLPMPRAGAPSRCSAASRRGSARRSRTRGSTYLLGYYPTHANWDGAYHDIRITVNRPGATIRSRRGYYANRFEPPEPAKARETLLAAVASPLEATELGLTARIAKGSARNSVTIAVRPAPDAITLTRTADRWIGALDFVVAQSLPNGETFKTFAVKADIELTDDQHTQMLKEGLSFDRTVMLRPDSHRLHIVVRDIPSGATGSRDHSDRRPALITNKEKKPRAVFSPIVSPAAAQPIETDRAGAGDADEQPDETEQDGELAAVHDRPAAARCVLREVRDRHLTREDEGDRPREQTEQHQNASDCLDHTRRAEQRQRQHRRVERMTRHAEQLLRAVRDIDERGNESKHAEERWCQTRQSGGSLHRAPV